MKILIYFVLFMLVATLVLGSLVQTKVIKNNTDSTWALVGSINALTTTFQQNNDQGKEVIKMIKDAQ